MAKKEKKKSSLSFRDYFATTVMGLSDVMAASVMTSYFMTYLTDYSGIANAAAIGTAILFGMRLFDAINDPIEAWIIDKAKVGKLGKYKPFILISILFECIGVSMLFFVPESIAPKTLMAVIWVVIAYFLYDIGASFYAPNLIYRTITLDSDERGKLMIAPRISSMVMGMFASSLIKIVTSVNDSFHLNSLHKSFGLVIMTMMLVMSALAVAGALLVIEKYHPKKEEEEEVRITDIFRMFKENDALRVRFSATIFSGFIWTFLFATSTYYIKYAYCVDLATGRVDMDRLGTLILVSSLLMLFPLIVGTLIATPLMKKLGSPIRLHNLCLILQGVPGGILFLMQILGVLQKMPVLFFVCMAIVATSIGIAFIPGETINIQCMDYEIYKNGKDRSALCNASTKFLDKMQNAFSSGMVGLVLVAIGYKVDPNTGDFIGELASIPKMNTWFIVIMGLIPCILAFIALSIFSHYPITEEIAADMKEKLEKTER